MSKLFKRVRLWSGLSGVFAFLLAVTMFLTSLAFQYPGQINEFLGIKTPTIDGSGNADDYPYKSDYTEDGIPSEEGLEKLLAAEDAFVVQQQEEGSVLLKNDGALPLAEDERSVTLFGRATADPLYRNRSGGPLKPGTTNPRLVSLKDALEAEGFSINETMYNAYANSSTKRVKYGEDAGSGNSSAAPSSIGEESASFYTAELQNSYANEYNDVAIVMFAREAGEGTDMTVDVAHEADGVPTLTLHKSEADLLKMIKDSGKFEKTVVLINSGNAMDLGWVDKEEYGVDACLWIGGPGLCGFIGVVNILTGKANPSGRLVDTYATSQLSSPAMQNFGDFRWTNEEYVTSKQDTDGRTEMYLVEAEGIYVGYKYYESRYYDSVLNQYNASSSVGRTETLSEGGNNISVYPSSVRGWDYAYEIVYPFGYGLSYTQFRQTIVADSFQYNAETDEFSVDVLVENIGEVAGKSVVQLYVQQPYTEYDRENLVEKSAIQLVGFEKTDLLSPAGTEGSSETVTVTVDRYLLASYDENQAKGYILDAGNYYFAIGDDAHDALNNILAYQADSEDMQLHLPLVDAAGNEVQGDEANVCVYSLEELDTASYRYSEYGEGVEVTNAFEGDQAIDINDFLPADQQITYLTRGGRGNDWSTSYPQPIRIAATDEMIEILNNKTYQTPADAPSVDSFKMGVDAGISLIDMKDVPLDDEKWDTFIDQFSLKELLVIAKDSYGTEPITGTINKPATQIGDGPDGSQFTYNFGDELEGTCYVNEVVSASTWNKEIIRQLGDFIAEDCMYQGTNGLWSPGANLHRTPYSGRNFEYYSEDSIMTYIYVSIECQAMNAKGLLAEPKHFAGNDQETNRVGVATLMTEQRFRQECLKGFEGAFTLGGCLSTMTAMNRIGLVPMTASDATQNVVLRKEWGFKGATITDALPSWKNYARTLESIVGGSDFFCFDDRVLDLQRAISGGDGYILQCVRESNKRFYYAFLQSNLVNGLTNDVVVTSFVAWWQPALIAANIAFSVLAVGALAFAVGGTVLEKREERKDG